MKSKDKLLDFIKYCMDHPDERFWVALRNWSKYYFIFAWRPKKPLTIAKDGNHDTEDLEKVREFGLEDTFYWS